jgi:gp16 family phage-associated protein
MPAESIFDPIPKELLRQAKSRLAYDGLSVEAWAKREGFNAKLVHQVLSGKRMAIRGMSLRVAVKLGLRPDPNTPAARQAVQTPAGRTEELPVLATPGSSIAGGPSIPDRNRRPVSQLGAAVR